MRCEDVRERLAEYAAGELPASGGLDVHLASCRECAGELARYRELASALRALERRVPDPPPGLQARIVASIPAHRVRDDVRRIATDHPRALTVGGAALGAAAIALLWWRAARRPVGGTAPVPSSLPVS